MEECAELFPPSSPNGALHPHPGAEACCPFMSPFFNSLVILGSSQALCNSGPSRVVHLGICLV